MVFAYHGYPWLIHRLSREVAAMTAATRGLDLLVLAGGIGEHSGEVRARLAASLAYLGVELDPVANAAATGDADIGRPGARVRTVVVTASEESEIPRGTRQLLGGAR